MSSTPGFFSKLFGRSVSRPTSISDGEPSSSTNGGSPSHEEYSDANGSSPVASKPLRYLSPTAMESSFSRISNRVIESNADSARKRPLDNPQTTSGFTNGSFYLSDTAKRFRGSVANTSLISEPVTRLELPRLDTTWSAGMGVLSPSNLSCSPNSSVRSLRSRITRPSSRTSVLSSKTAALLGQIEKVSTPAQDARRMPMLRVGLNKERWSSLGPSTTSNPPPLTRISTVPSRYQVMSSYMTPMQKKPYWRDVARERPEVVVEESRVPSELSSSVSLPTRAANGDKNGVKEHPVRAHQPVLKGPDGSNVNRDRNKFSANEISMVDLETLNNVKSPDLSQFTLPTTGYLSKDVKPSFSFKKPVKVTEIMEESESSEESDSDPESSASSGSGREEESDSGREEEKNSKQKTSEKTSDTSSSAENTSKETSNEESKKVSPPRTTANDVSTFVAKPVSVTAPSTIAAVAAFTSSSTADWSCSDCFVNNKAGDVKCACCGGAKPGSAPSASSSSNVFGANAFKPASASTSSAPSTANWDCPSCCVSNKAVDVKCVCCGDTQPGATVPPSSSSNVFGNKAFKPTAAASATVTFGFGSAAPSAPSAPTVPTVPSTSSAVPSFGIKTSTETPSSSATTTTGFSFGLKSSTEPSIPSSTSLPTITVTQPAPTVSKPMFGGSTTSTSFGTTGTNGPFSFGLKATNGEGAKNGSSSATPSIPLFSSTPAVSSTTPAPLFGLPPASSTLTSTSTAAPTVSSSLFSTPSFTPSSTLFGASSTGSTLLPFGSSSTSTTTPASATPLFGSSTLSTTTATPSIPLFGGASSTGSTAIAAAPSGSSSTAPSLSFNFGPSSTASTMPKVPLFGASTEVKPLFGASKPSDDEGPGAKKAAMFGGSSGGFPFGAAPASTVGGGGGTNMFGSSGGTVAPFGSLTQSASTPSFSLSAAAPPTSFNFGTQPLSSGPPPSSFTFGASQPASSSAPSAPAPFVFGSQSSQAAPPSFGIGSFGAPSAPAASLNVPPVDASNPFAFHGSSSSSSSSGARKMIQAKRRLPGKR